MCVCPLVKRLFSHRSTAVALVRWGISQRSMLYSIREISHFIFTSKYNSSLCIPTAFFVKSCSTKIHILFYEWHFSQPQKSASLSQLCTYLPLSQSAAQYLHTYISPILSTCTLETPKATTFPWSVDRSAFFHHLYIFICSNQCACRHTATSGFARTVSSIKTCDFFHSLYTPIVFSRIDMLLFIWTVSRTFPRRCRSSFWWLCPTSCPHPKYEEVPHAPSTNTSMYGVSVSGSLLTVF